MQSTLRELIQRRDNDYTAEEQAFLRATGQELIRVEMAGLDARAAWPSASVSVVVPSFNGHRTLPYQLRFLRGQRYRNFEIVLVDDGSTPPISLDLLAEESAGVRVKLVRTRTNLRYSAARNVGIQCAEGDVLVLMDDDLVGSDIVTLAAALRHQHVIKMVFIGFRGDVDWTAFVSTSESVPPVEDDWRWLTEIKPHHVRLSVLEDEDRRGPLRILEESVCLKTLGFGGVLGKWDLPTMVSSHGLSMARQDAVDAGGFVEQAGMNYWGIDDLSFGATMIAYGVKVAPALEWRCRHLRQGGRGITREKQFEEFLERRPCYLEYLEQLWPAQRFPIRRIRRVSRQGSVEELEIRARG